MQLSFAISSIAFAALAEAHCKITYSTGDFGGVGAALGLQKNNYSSISDVTLFSEPHLPFGATQSISAIDPYDAVPKAIRHSGNNILPQIDGGSTVSMNLFQINEDGAGPMKCLIDASGKGDDFTPIRVTINVPGGEGISPATEQEWPLEAIIPSGVKCQGAIAGHARLCFVKCVNPRGYGGTVTVQQVPEIQKKLELRSTPNDDTARKEGKQGNKARRFGDVSRRQDKDSVDSDGDENPRKEGKEGNKKARDVNGAFAEAMRRSDERRISRIEGKSGNKVRGEAADVHRALSVASLQESR